MYETNLEFVKSYKPKNKQIEHLRILLHGPVGAGKSSFINSVASILKGRVAGPAMTDAISGRTFTGQYKTYKFSREPEDFYSFVFNDIMGFEQGSDRGVSVEDVKKALRGHVSEGYKFNPGQALQEDDNGYNPHPTVEEKVHVLVCVVPATTVSLLTPSIVQKMRAVRLAASTLGIPQMAVLTKVDEACSEVAKDPSNIHKSKYLKEKVDQFHMLLGIPKNCIFLVKNYSDEIKLKRDVSAPLVCALNQMVLFGEDFLNDMET